ncbi:FAD:protein FMN transferase [Halopseudomonas salegens]|uniref:FAD:protein FMN transferase n=1 Tax=Halopseudomonas salegens TaxID=1434072 RepID=A0A1H2HV98_9GAMM|nr:FAD:protein FMN transferase [Halopseudomonas salegens]SDU35823.1 thiamine biosynthesis lipoprotein [Halopseudomonas salegens]
MLNPHRLLALLLSVLLINACSREPQPEQHHLQGNIFGTFYQITLAGAFSEAELEALHQGAVEEMQAVDASMSTYRDDSELSQLNQGEPGEWVTVSRSLFTVLEASDQIARTSDGAFDVTVGGLVNLWSFGPEARPLETPSDSERERRLSEVGYHYLELDTDGQRLRRQRDVYVDLSAIAKGYAVDRVSQWLLDQGVANHLVNLGGDLIALGVRSDGAPWRIGVELPDSQQMEVAQHILPVRDLSVATSGDYRNYFEADGQRYSHTIDPRNGMPVQHKLASVTVMHPSAMLADGWATALMVLGTEAAQAMAEQQGLTVLLLSRSESGGWDSWASSAMHELYGDEVLEPLQ